MNFSNRAMHALWTAGTIAAMTLSQSAFSASVIIRGNDAGNLMSALTAIGVTTLTDDHGGQTIDIRQIDCYQPVVPNPQAHCYVQEYYQLNEFIDESKYATAIFEVLEKNYLTYDDGSVGANKVGIRNMTCYLGLLSEVAECEGETWD